jgi:iron complex outermembrane receptor protein
VVVNWPWETGAAGRFDFTLVANWNDTEVTRVPATEEPDALSPPPPLFARVNVLSFEEGTPDDKLAAVVDWRMDRWGATLRATRYGSVLDPGTTEALDFEHGSATLVDLEGRVDLTGRIRLALGAENLLDEYPDPFPVSRNTTGDTPFTNYAPFGRSGRYVYGRLSVGF